VPRGLSFHVQGRDVVFEPLPSWGRGPTIYRVNVRVRSRRVLFSVRDQGRRPDRSGGCVKEAEVYGDDLCVKELLVVSCHGQCLVAKKALFTTDSLTTDALTLTMILDQGRSPIMLMSSRAV